MTEPKLLAALAVATVGLALILAGGVAATAASTTSILRPMTLGVAAALGP